MRIMIVYGYEEKLMNEVLPINRNGRVIQRHFRVIELENIKRLLDKDKIKEIKI